MWRDRTCAADGNENTDAQEEQRTSGPELTLEAATGAVRRQEGKALRVQECSSSSQAEWGKEAGNYPAHGEHVIEM